MVVFIHFQWQTLLIQSIYLRADSFIGQLEADCQWTLCHTHGSVCTACSGVSLRILRLAALNVLFTCFAISVQTAAEESKKLEEEISEKYKELQKEVKTLRTEVQRNTTLQDIVDILSNEKSELNSTLESVRKEMQKV